MAVRTSGAVLSSLLYEHSNSEGDQEGFLLGRVVSHVTDTISDSQLNNRKEETVSYIYNYIVCNGPFSWYDHAGRIVVDKLKAVLKNDKHKEVIGWYKWRRQSTLAPSLRERAIHKALLEAFPGVSADRFLFCLFSASCTSNLATHSFDHLFQYYDGSSFKCLPLTIVNLKDMSDSDYKHQANNTVNPSVGIYGETLHTFRPEFEDPSTKRLHQVQGVHSLNSRLHQQLMELCHQVSLSEEALGTLSSEVQTLRERWKAKRYPPQPIHKASLFPLGQRHTTQEAAPPHPVPQQVVNAVPAQLTRHPSNQEQITEELKDLFVVPPVETKSQGAEVNADSSQDASDFETLNLDDSQSLLKEPRAVSPALSHHSVTSSDDMDVTEAKVPNEKSPGLSRKEIPLPLLNCENVPDAPTSLASGEESPAKKGDAFSFVDDLIQKAQSPPTTKANLSFVPADVKKRDSTQRARKTQTRIVDGAQRNVDLGKPQRTVTPTRGSTRSSHSTVQSKVTVKNTGQGPNIVKSKTHNAPKKATNKVKKNVATRSKDELDIDTSMDEDMPASPTF